MEIIEETKCPNCKKTIQKIKIRRPYIKRIEHKYGNDNRIKTSEYKRIRGVYKWIVKLSQIRKKEKE